MVVCLCAGPAARPVIPTLLRASSQETRRAVDTVGRSAIDVLIEYGNSHQAWFPEVVSKLLLTGAPVLPRNAPLVLPIAARLKARLEALPKMWEVHEAMVGMAFDFQEMKEAEARVEERERRVRELEEELKALGAGTEDTNEDEGDEEASGEGASLGEGAVAAK